MTARLERKGEELTVQYKTGKTLGRYVQFNTSVI